MSATLADSLELVLPMVPPALVPAEDHAELLEVARGLAPIHRCGFEVRLASSRAVDFQQGIGSREGEPGVLLGHLSRSRAGGPGWNGLADLVSGWEERLSHLQQGIQDIWLEFDRPHSRPPSLFVGLVRGLEPETDRRLLAFEALDRVAGRQAWGRFEDTVARCFDSCPEPSYVSNVGLMLGRPAPFLRINVRLLEPGLLGEYLARVGWVGSVEEPVELLDRLQSLVDHVTVCLDAGDEVHGRLGFECYLEEQPPAEVRWPLLLDHLVESGWCTREKRDALLEWPRVLVPGDGAEAWPADLLRATLLRPQDHFSALDLRLSHVKLVSKPGEPIEAKGYFGFLHRWLRPQLEPDRPRSRNGRQRRRDAGAAGAVAAATAFLLDSRTGDGWWRDFFGTAGATEEWTEVFSWSDEWVTAFVGTALADSGDMPAREAAREAWDLLVERRLPSGGWGYNRISPVDADSTTWGLRLATALGLGDSTPARRAQRSLQRHELGDGGLTTYLGHECPRPRGGRMKPPEEFFGGWCLTSHPCVTAAAASLDGERRRGFLRRAQRDDGSWAAYWWRDDEYATALAAEAMAGAGVREPVERAVRWALGREAPGDSPFAMAWLIRILRLSDDPDARAQLHRSTAWLVDHQDPDGAWPASARMVVPRPDVRDPQASRVEPSRSLDDGRAFTTAAVLSALTGSPA